MSEAKMNAQKHVSRDQFNLHLTKQKIINSLSFQVELRFLGMMAFLNKRAIYNWNPIRFTRS